MHKRLKEIRKQLGLTQAEFGIRLGVTNSAVAYIEKGKRNLTEQMLLAICREYNVSEKWLRTGEGEMFIVTENALLDQIAKKYNLDALDRAMTETYYKLSKDHKEAVKSYLIQAIYSVDLYGFTGEKPEELLNGLTKEEYVKQAAQTAAQEAEKQAELDWEQAKKGMNKGSNTA